jgi:hypothetical protein
MSKESTDCLHFCDLRVNSPLGTVTSTKSFSNCSIGLVYPNGVKTFEPLTRQFMSNPIPPGDITPPFATSNAATPPMGKP